MRTTPVDRLDVYALSVPLRHEIANARLRFDAYQYLVVEVTSDGLVGQGWTYTQGAPIEAIGRLVLDLFGPAVIGLEPSDVTAQWQGYERAAYSIGLVGPSRLAVSAIDVALWDLRGLIEGRPLVELTGGTRRAVPCYISCLNAHLDVGALEEQARDAVAAGYSRLKMKVGGRPLDHDVRRVRAVHAAAPELEIWMDANRTLDREAARDLGMAVADLGVTVFEEPLEATDFHGLARLCRELPLALAGGESLYEPSLFPLLMDAGVQWIQPDPARIGGVTTALRICRDAYDRGLHFSAHTCEEISTHLAASLPDRAMVEHIPDISLSELGVVSPPLRFVGGTVEQPAAAGLGVHMTAERLRGRRMGTLTVKEAR